MPTNNFPLRLDPQTKRKLVYIAKQNSRSINKEIEHLVKQHIQAYENAHGVIAVTEE